MKPTLWWSGVMMVTAVGLIIAAVVVVVDGDHLPQPHS